MAQAENKVYRKRGNGIEHYVLENESIPKAGKGEVLIRIHAVSLNYRDIMIAKGLYGNASAGHIIPLSDGAGEIQEIGEGVTNFKKGDRVTPIFNPAWIHGEYRPEIHRFSLGGHVDGVAAQYIVIASEAVVHIPQHLSYEEAATLPCAAVTAWNALFEGPHPVLPGDTVLIEGTGGVSIFGLQFAVAAGARVIVTSSSNEKLQKAKALGAAETVNYKENQEWHNEVLRLTNNIGVDHVIEVGGKDSVSGALNSLKVGGNIYVVGGVSGFDASFPLRSVLFKTAHVRGVLVGSKQLFEKMNVAITANKIKPVVDKIFEIGKLQEALRYLESAAHFGKVVVSFS